MPVTEPVVTTSGEPSVRTTGRTLRVLETLAAAGGSLGLRELSRRTGLPIATIHRVAATLDELGYVRRENDRCYALGPSLMQLGEAAASQLTEWAKPSLRVLAERTGESANLAILERDRAVYVAHVPSRYAMGMFTGVGRHVFLHSTAVGKVLLAGQKQDVVDDILRTGLPRQTPRTIVDERKLRAHLDTVRERGFATDDGEHEPGVCCIAVPVGAPLRAAMSVTALHGRLPTSRQTAVVNILHEIAERLTLGGGPACC